MIPRFKPYYNYKEFLAAIVPSRGNIQRFESEFATKFGCKYGVMFQYGRSGLYSLFKIWNFKNEEIICPAYTCVVVSHAIVLSGNIPVFIDCGENSFNMDYEEIEQSITEKTKAIIVTHLFGYPMDVYRINEIVKKSEEKYGHKIYVIQDVAHSFGARFKEELVTKFGDAAIFGLNISKIINSIFGGMVITNDIKTYNKLKEYQKNNFVKGGFRKSFARFLYLVTVYFAFNKYIYSFVNWLEQKGLLDKFVKYYDASKIDFPKDWNRFPSEVEARIGLVQLRKYNDIIDTRIAQAKKYTKEFENQNAIKILPFMEGATYSCFVAFINNRKKCLEKFRRNGIQLGTLIEYSVPYMDSYLKYKKREYPISKYYSEHAINLPNWPGLRVTETKKIVKCAMSLSK